MLVKNVSEMQIRSKSDENKYRNNVSEIYF